MMDTKLLRQKILDLAIRGKLVPQDPNDEPASALLERIRAEKARLVKDGKIKKDKTESFIFKGSDNRHYENVPHGWIISELCNICEITSSKRIFQNEYVTTGIPFYRTKEIVELNLQKQVSTVLYISEEKYTRIKNELDIPRKNDILLSAVGTIGISWIVDDRTFYFKDGNLLWLKNIIIDSYFLKYMLDKIFTQIDIKSGTAYSALTIEKLKQFLIPIPPLAEQHRIVAKIETLLDKINNIEKDNVDLLQSVILAKSKILDLAVRGKLVPQDPNDEPASVLLERIRAEKKGSDKSHYEKLEEIPYEIPENWAWIRLGEVCNIFNGNSINEDEKVKKYVGQIDGFNYIATKDIDFDGKINYENGVKIPFPTVKPFRKAYAGTPLLCIEGGSAGRKIGILSEDVCFGNKLCAFESEIINTKFLYYFLQSPEFQGLFATSKSGLIGGVSINTIKTLTFALPPLAEQTRIVAAIDLLLNQINLLKE